MILHRCATCVNARECQRGMSRLSGSGKSLLFFSGFVLFNKKYFVVLLENGGGGSRKLWLFIVVELLTFKHRLGCLVFNYCARKKKHVIPCSVMFFRLEQIDYV